MIPISLQNNEATKDCGLLSPLTTNSYEKDMIFMAESSINQNQIEKQYKKCPKCKIKKFLTEFSPNKNHKDGLASHCKACRRQSHKEHKDVAKRYYQKNREIIAKKAKQCREQNRELIARNRKIYRQEHREEISKQRRLHYQVHKKFLLLKIKKWRQNNKERLLKIGRLYYQQNKEKCIARSLRYQKANKEKVAKQQRKYYQTKRGKEIKRRKDNKRRALKYNAIYEIFDPKEIFERDGYRCKSCRKKTRPDYNQYHPLYPNLDHITPLSKGGAHTRKNTQCLCRQCNLEKGNTGTGDQLRMFG